MIFSEHASLGISKPLSPLVAAAVVITLLLPVRFSNAGSIDLTVRYPDIVATDVYMGYDASQKQFSIAGEGLLMGMDLDGVVGGDEYWISDGKYALDASIDNSGKFTGGTVSLYGDLRDVTHPSDVLNSGLALSGTLSNFGYDRTPTGGGVFEFEFDVTDGYLHVPSLFHANHGGIIASGTTGNFGASEFNASFGVDDARVDTFVPTPMALPAGAVLIAGVLWHRRRRQPSRVDRRNLNSPKAI